ncbi:MAG: EAL domain-containing protein [Granulosicoccus sp.]|nr:EAL domain-containing protein [Granulosicoccus sp.]
MNENNANETGAVLTGGLEATSDYQPLVLLVDDDLASLIMAEEALEDGGFRVVQAENGLEAVEACKQETPDLIIMDVIMPKMNGFEACEAIRSTEEGAHIPILMVTGLEDIESINLAYEVGATDFLTKPVNFFILPHRVRYMLRSKLTADELRASRSQLDHAQRIAQLGHWEWRREDQKIRWSKACRHLFDLPESLVDNDISVLIEQVDEKDRDNVIQCFRSAVREAKQFNVEFRIVQKGRPPRVMRQQAEPQIDEDGQCISMLGTMQDITERHNAQEQIHNLAYYDHVTGLPNRALLFDRLNAALDRSSKFDKKFAVLFLDLDRFKLVNDTLGHDAGDELLSQVSIRLSETLRESDVVARLPIDSDTVGTHTIARLGGDEFVVLLSEISLAEDAAVVARRIASRIAETYDIDGSVVNISTTIGISIYPNDGGDAEALIKNADIAMYHAKKRGRNGFQFYSEDIHQKAQDRFSLEQDLRKAINEEQFRLVYQPKIDTQTGEVSGVEALIRWEHPTAGPISPQEFITLAEETELIIPLGEWIMETACIQAKAWQDMGLGGIHMAVNCSSIQLIRADIPALLLEVLNRTGLSAPFLEIELTESLLLDDVDRGIEILHNLQSLGVKTSIDDFGTGFSSMSYLRRLPVDKLKIDQSFVREISNDQCDAAIVNAIITLASNLGLSVIAEGVETQAQFDFLAKNRCDEAQGYLISPPLESDEFVEWIHQRDSLRKAS